jgi:hypothetical protein
MTLLAAAGGADAVARLRRRPLRPGRHLSAAGRIRLGTAALAWASHRVPIRTKAREMGAS